MADKNGCKALIGLDEILTYMKISHKPLFYQFVKMGLPARVINSRWYAHKDNIDEFFRQITLNSENEIPPDAD